MPRQCHLSWLPGTCCQGNPASGALWGVAVRAPMAETGDRSDSGVLGVRVVRGVGESDTGELELVCIMKDSGARGWEAREEVGPRGHDGDPVILLVSQPIVFSGTWIPYLAVPPRSSQILCPCFLQAGEFFPSLTLRSPHSTPCPRTPAPSSQSLRFPHWQPPQPSSAPPLPGP